MGRVSAVSYLGLETVADHYGVSYNTVYNWVKKGWIPVEQFTLELPPETGAKPMHRYFVLGYIINDIDVEGTKLAQESGLPMKRWPRAVYKQQIARLEKEQGVRLRVDIDKIAVRL